MGDAGCRAGRRHHGRQAAAAAEARGFQRADPSERRPARRRRSGYTRRLTGTLKCGRFSLPLSRPLVMRVLNVTPDSFSDGGRFLDPRVAIEHAHRLVEQGADILDVSDESSRPGAQPTPKSIELERMLPIVEAIKAVPVSVDTRRPTVMKAALAKGASMINDIEALAAPGALEAVAASECGVCLMHKKGEPATMQKDPHYRDVVGEVLEFLQERVQSCEKEGIKKDRIAVDPGFGFGKTVAHNFRLLKELKAFGRLGVPVVAG